MATPDLFAALRARWNEQGIAHAPGVTAAELDAWEARHGRTLPAEVREYFLALNGCQLSYEASMELDSITFLPLAELKPVVEEIPEARGRRASSYFAFAINESWANVYALRLRPGRNRSAKVLMVSEGWHRTIAASLGEFLEGYLASNYEMLLPVPPTPLAQRIRGWLMALFIPAGDIKPRLRNGAAIERRLTRFATRLVREHPHLRRQKGAVKLRFRVDAHGRTGLVEVADPGPIPEILDESIRLVGRMRFSPARIDRRAVAVQIEIPLYFRFPR